MIAAARCVALGGLCIWCLSTTACRDRDVVTASYATMREAVAEGAVARGHLPESLPAGVREIRVAYDLGASRRWGLFDFPPEQRPELERMLDRETSFEGLRCNPPRRIEWWPVQLRGDLDGDRLRATGLRVYHAGPLILAVHWQQGRAYYWTPES